MKRKFFWVIAVMLMISLVIPSCAKPAPAPAPAPAPTPAPAPAKEVIEWRVDSPIPEWRDIITPMKDWADRITADSNGQLVMTFYPGGALGISLPDMLRVLKAGTVEASFTAPYYFTRDEPVLGLFHLNGTWAKRTDYLKVADAIREAKQKIYSNWDVVLLGQAPGDATIVGVWTNKPVNKLEDLKGMKIRCWNRYQGLTLVATDVGVSPSTIAQADMYMAMKTGVIDGILYPPAAGEGFGLGEISKYCTIIYPLADSMDLLASKSAWEALSPDLQGIVMEETKKLEQYCIDKYLDTEFDAGPGREYCEASGVTFSWLPEAERARIREAAFRVWKDELEKADAAWVYDKLSVPLLK